MKVLTYNVHLFPPYLKYFSSIIGVNANKDDDFRKQEICKLLRNSDADIIGLTEVWYGDEYFINQLEDIYPYSYKPDIDFNLCKLGIFGSGLLLLCKHPIIDAEYEIYKDSCGDDSYVQKSFIKSIVKINNKNFSVFLTHTQAGYKNKSNVDVQIKQLAQLARSIYNYKQKYPDNKIIAFGDFNVESTSFEYNYLCDIFNVINIVDIGYNPQFTVDSDNTLKKIFCNDGKIARLDYIFTDILSDWCYTKPKALDTEKLKKSFKHNFMYTFHDLSDHYPLMAKLVL